MTYNIPMPTTRPKERFTPGVTVDVVVFTIEDKQLKILLIRRADEPFKNIYALPGGFVHKGETAADSAERVLRDKGGIENVYIEQLYTFDAVKRDPRGQIISITYFALAPREKINIANNPLTEEPTFVSARDLPALAFDHADIVAYALKRLADKILYTNIIYSLLPRQFTLTELQTTYETVLSKKIDKRNFRKKFIDLNIIRATGTKRSGLRQRPAELYTFKAGGVKELDIFFKK